MASQTVELLTVINAHRSNLSHDLRRKAAIGLVRAAKELGRINEAECSGEMDARLQMMVDIRTERLEGLVRKHASALQVRVSFNGDPRGFAVLIHFGPSPKAQPGNTWGGAEYGWGVG